MTFRPSSQPYWNIFEFLNPEGLKLWSPKSTVKILQTQLKYIAHSKNKSHVVSKFRNFSSSIFCNIMQKITANMRWLLTKWCQYFNQWTSYKKTTTLKSNKQKGNIYIKEVISLMKYNSLPNKSLVVPKCYAKNQKIVYL